MKTVSSALVLFLLFVSLGAAVIGDKDVDLSLAQDTHAAKYDYVPSELIVKFRKDVAGILESQLLENRETADLRLSSSLDELNERYEVRDIKALFKDFKRNRQRVNGILQKDESLLTKKEKRLSRRSKRAPANGQIPALDRIYKIELGSTASTLNAMDEYRSDPAVEYAQLNNIYSIDLTPNDTLYSIQWPLNNTGQTYPESGNYNEPPGTADSDIDAPEAWDIETGDVNIVVGVIDTGVDYGHRDLVGNLWINETEQNGSTGVDDDDNGYVDDIYGYDFANDDADPVDDHGHGTHCAGIISAKGDNNKDITGVCWDAKIMSLKFILASGYGYSDDAASAIYYAVENGADILSNSWGGSADALIEDAFNYAYSQGLVCVAAAGNTGSTSPHYPAYYASLISVAATNSNDEKAPFSTYGSWVDIAAPGVDVLSLRAAGTDMGTVYDNYTTVASGTSMACPHVAGASSLLLSRDPFLSVDEVRSQLKDTADTIDPNVCQSGRLNVYSAVYNLVTAEGRVNLGEEVYSCDDSAEVSLRDSDLEGAGTQDVNITTTGGDSETLTLIETDPCSGIFGASLDVCDGSVVVGDDVLQVAHGQTITVSYYDANDGTGSPASVEDTASVDCIAPVVQTVDVTTDITGRKATVDIQTDEATFAVVRCGLSCGGPYDITGTDGVSSTTHTVTLQPLIAETTYYFVVEATDAAGNLTIDDNSGACYMFTTPYFAGFYVPSVFSTIQEAINATWNGDTVWVADGTYTGDGNRDVDFLGKAITVRSENGPVNCIVDCEGTESNPHRGFIFHNQEPPAAVLDGFTIINGYAESMGEGYIYGAHGMGAAIYIEGEFTPFYTSPTIKNCVIHDCNGHLLYGVIGCNVAASPTIINCDISGGFSAIKVYPNCQPTITNCVLYGNSRGVDLLETSAVVNDCVIVNNTLGIYGSLSDVEMTGCTISSSIYNGVYNEYGSLSISGCLISNNGRSGIRGEECNLTLSDSIIAGNQSQQYSHGGGVYLLSENQEYATVKNCLFADNEADVHGGAVYSNQYYVLEPYANSFVNCTFVGNTAGSQGGAYYCSKEGERIFKNCIFWDNYAPTGTQISIGSYSYPSEVTVSYSDVQGGQSQIYVDEGSTLNWGQGNIENDPCFINPVNDYHLDTNSVCIDAGDPNDPNDPNETDLDGKPRITDGDGDEVAIVDMGPYEFDSNYSEPNFVLYVADSDIPVAGRLTRNYISTHTSDNTYQSITEVESGGAQPKRYSYLEHKWTIDVEAGGDALTFHVEAYHTANSEGDDFIFAYSTDDADYVDMVTVTSTSDANTTQSYEMPNDVNGTVYIRVKDTDQTKGNRVLDTIHVDNMYIFCVGPAGPNTPPPPTPGVTITETGGLTIVYEEGPTSDAYTVVLDSQPSDTVTIAVDPDTQTEVNSNGEGNPIQLTFLTTDWDQPQTVTVTAIDDDVFEGTHTSTITHTASSSDPDYNDIDINDVVATVVDNDTCVASTMYVYQIDCMTAPGSKGKEFGEVHVWIQNNCGGIVSSGATVTGTFTGDFDETVQGTTSGGYALLMTTTQARRPSYTFCVDDVNHATLVYDPNSNVETCDSYSP